MKRTLLLLVSALGLAILSWRLQLPQHQGRSWIPEPYGGPFGDLRSQFLSHLSGVSADARGLVAGLAIGDTSILSGSTADTMKVVSLTHLTAVSGANCAIVIGAIHFGMRWLPISRWFRFGLSMMGLVAYVLVVGQQPSVLRAATMAAIVMFGVAIGRRGAAFQALALCIIILLIADPWLSVDYGFQLSVLATIGILQLAPLIAVKCARYLPRWLSLVFSVALGAQLLCLPVLLELQPGISTYSVPANLFAEPIVAPITVLGIAACALVPFVPWLTSALTWIASLGAWVILWISDFFANAPAATLSWPAGIGGVICSIALILVIVFWLRAKSVRIQAIAATLVGLLCAVTLGSCTSRQIQGLNWPPSDWSVVSCDVGQGDATLIRSEGKIALIDVGRKPGPIRTCLNHLHIQTIDLLVLTHFDMDHVGGLDGAIAGRKINSALITSYQDERPAAAITWRKLLSKVQAVTQAETGMAGVLGQFRWQVLSPHRGAPEAKDSNDGSVTMLFSSADLVILTLADLGQKGQMRLMDESASWLGSGFGSTPVVVKVSHHGSADQFADLYKSMHPTVGLFSVGLGNDYGHPTEKTLRMLQEAGARIYRTDLQGGIAVSSGSEGLQIMSSGRD